MGYLVYLQSNPTKITLALTSDSWIQVVDADHSTNFQQFFELDHCLPSAVLVVGKHSSYILFEKTGVGPRSLSLSSTF